MYNKLVKSHRNIDYKFTPLFWNQFAKKEHYFKGAVLLEELKLSGYFNFLKNINLNNGPVLKTDLYVEAKNKNDNFFPYLVIKQCIGMDISLEVVKMARNNLMHLFPNMKFIVADVRHLPFKGHSFNSIISDSTLDHIPRKDLSHALLEAKRIIKNKGKFILSLNNVFNFPFACDFIIKNLFFRNHFIAFSFNPQHIRKLLAGLGFKTIDWEGIIKLDYFGLFLIKLSNRIKIIKPLVKEWLYTLTQLSKFNFLKMFFCLQFIILAENECQER